MKSKSFLLVITYIFISMFAPSLASAEYQSVPSEEAHIWVEKTGRDLIIALSEKNINQKFKALDDIVYNNIDLEYLGKFVVGKYWKTMTREQRIEYISLFKRYANSLYRLFPIQFDKDLIDFSIEKVLVESNYTLISTNIEVSLSSENNPDINVEFRVHKNQGRIMVTDLKVAESSFALTYRNRFYEMLKVNDDEVSWFLEDLNDIINAQESKSQEILENYENYN